jgi:Fe-S oxidoreductase
MPLYAPLLSKIPWLANVRNNVGFIARFSEKFDGFTSKRPLPHWRSDVYRPEEEEGVEGGPEVILFGDTFNTYFERENLVAARDLLISAGYRVLTPKPVSGGGRPLCCGRTYLTAGKIEQARKEAKRLVDTYYPYAKQGVPIVGLEPSCLLCLRDEVPSLIPDQKTDIVAGQAMLFEEFCIKQTLNFNLRPIGRKALVHGHCHQKAFSVAGTVETVLKMIPDLEVDVVQSSCCGMAGVFGYGAETYDISMQMGELSIFPAVRETDDTTLIVADGVSCRHQIEHGTKREAHHVVRLLRQALIEEESE